MTQRRIDHGVKPDFTTRASLAAQAAIIMGMGRRTEYRVECFGPDDLDREEYLGLLADAERADAKGDVALAGKLRRYAESLRRKQWEDVFCNLVVNQGLNDSLDKHFKGSGYTASWFVGLTSGSTFAAGDTMATHAGWTEVTAYDEANRPTLTLGSVVNQSVDNSASKAVFSLNGSASVTGSFVTSNNTKGGSTGILYGVGAFSEGTRSVNNGDTLQVTTTLTAAAA